MDYDLKAIAQRIAALRAICELSAEHMGKTTGMSTEEYLEFETGSRDFSFTFLYKCAAAFGVDIVEIITGEAPHLKGYTIVREGGGLPIRRRAGFDYSHLAARFTGKLCEPFVVTAPYIEAQQNAPIEQGAHEGQEFNYILSGTMKFQIDGHIETLNPGDSVYYDSSRGHGMIACGGQPCVFISVVLKPNTDGQ